MAIKHSIRNSCLLINVLDRAHKHQLRDFFNSYGCSQYLLTELANFRVARHPGPIHHQELIPSTYIV
jgi:hypothetical protein